MGCIIRKEELPHSEFQTDFLRPFKCTKTHNANPETRDVVSYGDTLLEAECLSNACAGTAMPPTDDPSMRPLAEHALGLTDSVRCFLCDFQSLDRRVRVVYSVMNLEQNG
jgi:hypothetical protein